MTTHTVPKPKEPETLEEIVAALRKCEDLLYRSRDLLLRDESVSKKEAQKLWRLFRDLGWLAGKLELTVRRRSEE